MLDNNITGKLSGDAKQKLETYQYELNYDLDLINDPAEGIEKCYTYPETTPEVYDNLLSGFIAYPIKDKIKLLIDFYSNGYKLSGKIDDTYFYPLNYDLKTYIVSENTSCDKYSYGQVKFSDDKSSVVINTEDSGHKGIVIDSQKLNRDIAGNYDGKIKIKGHMFKKQVELNSIENPM